MNHTLLIAAWAVLGMGIGAGLVPLARRNLSKQDGNLLPAAVIVSVTAVVFGLLAWRLPRLPELLGYCLFAATGIAASVVDLAEQRLPRSLVLPAYPAVIGVFSLAAALHHDVDSLARAFAGMIVLPAVYFTLALLSRGGVGAGDIRLAGPAGWVLTWHGWTMLATGTLLALLFASFAGLTLIIRRRATRHTAIPFGPAMVAGALTAIILAGR